MAVQDARVSDVTPLRIDIDRRKAPQRDFIRCPNWIQANPLVFRLWVNHIQKQLENNNDEIRNDVRVK